MKNRHTVYVIRRTKTNWPNAHLIPRKQRGLFLARANRNQQPCVYGHLSCSDRDRGPCSDELLHLIDREHDEKVRQKEAAANLRAHNDRAKGEL